MTGQCRLAFSEVKQPKLTEGFGFFFYVNMPLGLLRKRCTQDEYSFAA